MIGTIVVNFRDLIDAGKDEEIDHIRSEFSCPYNKDVENFIKEKAVLFSKQGIAATYLVLKQYRGEKNSLSNTQRRRINKFSSYDEDLRRYIVSALLIGQLAKNYANGYDRLIEGDKLLRIACDKVMQIQRISSGRFVYLECEDKPRLLEFYERNGF